MRKITEKLCCEELSIFTKDNITQEFTVKELMQPVTKTTTTQCQPRSCNIVFPDYFNVGTKDYPIIYKVADGSAELEE